MDFYQNCSSYSPRVKIALPQGSLVLHRLIQGKKKHALQTSSPQKPLGQFKAKFHMEPPWAGGTKVCSVNQDSCHAHVWLKAFKNFLRNQRANDPKAWYTALGRWAQHKLKKMITRGYLDVFRDVQVPSYQFFYFYAHAQKYIF